jgi:hypothetical protein
MHGINAYYPNGFQPRLSTGKGVVEMTIRNTVAIFAALWVLFPNMVTAQEIWDSEDSGAAAEKEEAQPTKDKEQKALPVQARDDEKYVEPPKKDEVQAGGEGGEGKSATSGRAPAASRKDNKPISAALLLGYGFGLSSGGLSGTNPFGFGVGARAGYTFDFNVYAGAKFAYFLGGKQDTIKSNVIIIGVVGGYQLKIDPVVFVPNIELGVAVVNLTNSSSVAPDPDRSGENFYLAPGVSFFYPIDMFSVGLDLSIPVIIKTPAFSGLSIFATGGVRF